MSVEPCKLREARGIFAIAAAEGDAVVGVVIVGVDEHPKQRKLRWEAA